MKGATDPHDFKAELRQIGNSQGFIVPKKVADRLNLKEGASYKIEIHAPVEPIVLNQQCSLYLTTIRNIVGKRKYSESDVATFMVIRGFLMKQIEKQDAQAVLDIFKNLHQYEDTDLFEQFNEDYKAHQEEIDKALLETFGDLVDDEGNFAKKLVQG